MVKFKIIVRNPTTPRWHDWRFDGDYDGYDTVGKAIDACRKQRESHINIFPFHSLVYSVLSASSLFRFFMQATVLLEVVGLFWGSGISLIRLVDFFQRSMCSE